MELKFTVQAKIKKSLEEVFDAVYNPKKLSKYFTTGGASGALDEGAESTMGFSRLSRIFSNIRNRECQESKDNI